MLGLIFAIAAICSIVNAILEIKINRNNPAKTYPPSKNLISFLFNLD